MRSVGAEVDTPEIAFVGVDVTGAASSSWVLAAPAASSSALDVSSRDPSSLADDATSVLDVSLLSADVLSSSVALAVRTVSVTDSVASLATWVADVSGVPATVAAVAVLVASLLIESLLLGVRVLDVTVDVASLAELSVLDVSRATVFSTVDAVSRLDVVAVLDVLVVASLARSLFVVVAAPAAFLAVEVAFVRDVCSPDRVVDRVVFDATCVAVSRADETVSLLDALVARVVEATASLELRPVFPASVAASLLEVLTVRVAVSVAVRPVFSASVTASLLEVLMVRVAVSVAVRLVSCPLRVNSLVVLAACVTASWVEDTAFLLSSLAVRVAAVPASLVAVLTACDVCVAV